MVLVTILTIFFIIVAAALVLIVLVQRPSGGGLSGAFGGAGGGSDTVFGGRTGDALTLSTVIAFVLFLGLSIGLNLIEVKPPGAAATDTASTTTQAPAFDPTTGLPIEGTSSTTGEKPPPVTITPMPPGFNPTAPGGPQPGPTQPGATEPDAGNPGSSDPGATDPGAGSTQPE